MFQKLRRVTQPMRTRTMRVLARSVLADVGVPRVNGFDMSIHNQSGYYSQLGQDVLVDAIFSSKTRSPIFVDVGAHDGRTFSNTYFLEKYRGWHGICIEANPELGEILRANRTCQVECCAISEVEGFGEYIIVSGYAEMLSGLSLNYDPRHRKRIRREVREHGGSVRSVRVPMRRLQSVLDSAGIQEIDFLTVDVEGGEIGVVQSIDFTRTNVHLMAIENNYNSSKVRRYLERLGFHRFVVLGHDEFFAGPSLLMRLVEDGRTHSRD